MLLAPWLQLVSGSHNTPLQDSSEQYRYLWYGQTHTGYRCAEIFGQQGKLVFYKCLWRHHGHYLKFYTGN